VQIKESPAEIKAGAFSDFHVGSLSDALNSENSILFPYARMLKRRIYQW